MAGRYPVEIRHRGAILDVSELDGLLTAILSGPKEIEPAQWLLAIWGGADNVPRWANDRERDRFVNLTLQHMSDIAERLDELSRSVRTAVWHPRRGRSGADDC
jgi:yecA family protein